MVELYKNFNKETIELETSDKYPIEAAICNALKYAGYTLPMGLYSKACDSLGDFMETNQQVENYYKTYSPTLSKEYHAKMPGYFKPSEVIEVLINGVNEWLGKDILSFQQSLSREEITSKLEAWEPILVIVAKDPQHHYILPLLGQDKNEESSTEGKGVIYTLETYNNIFNDELKDGTLFDKIKPFHSNNKWVITIKPAEPVI